MIPKTNEVYRHFKGNLYQIITIAIHSETEEQMVVYQGLYGDNPVYCRPLSMFSSKVDHDKYPDVTQEYRFERVEEEKEEVDPLILEFLDADSIIDKKNILTALQYRITDEMINTLAVVMDVVIEEGTTQERYRQLKSCLDTMERYEIER